MEPHRSKEDSNIMRLIIKLFHVFGAIQFSFSVIYDYTFVNIPEKEFPLMSAFGGKFKFLTFWNAITLSLYFIICSYIDFCVNTKKNEQRSPLIVRIRDILLPVICFPVSMFVGVTFWGLYAVDRNLVLPEMLDKYFPSWLNHIMHTNIVIFMILELILTYRKYPTRLVGLSGLITYQLTYIAWMHIVYFKSGLWVYNIFAVLNVPQRAAFLTFSVALCCAFYFVGEKVNNIVWGTIEKRSQQKQKKAK